MHGLGPYPRAERVLERLQMALSEINAFVPVIAQGNAVAREAGEVVDRIEDVIARSITRLSPERREALRDNLQFMLAVIDRDVEAIDVPPGLNGTWAAAATPVMQQTVRAILAALDQRASAN